ncbi:MAG: radical SAM protein, partial [Acidobacteriota bacterium]
MISHIYVEAAVREHPRTVRILRRFSSATVVACERYGEVFNPRAQNFRLQKRRPALILAEKFDNHVLPAPPGYGIGGARNYYFSHMLNCVYDCRYCFLQGMYRSANYVLFVNFDDFKTAILETLKFGHGDRQTFFFSGYDCDSLAFEPISGFAEAFLPFFRRHPEAILELRTKSLQVQTLLESPPTANCVVAFSLTPDPVARALEHRAPPVRRRLATMKTLAERGWPLGLRFDPLIYHHEFRTNYDDTAEEPTVLPA